MLGQGKRRAVAMAAVATAAALVGALAPLDAAKADHGEFAVSQGIYRIPYADGLDVTPSNDHHNHPNVRDRVDLVAGEGQTIVAAASGIVRAVVDIHGDDPEEHSCLDSDTVPGNCSDYNNYVWIEHPNGEWTKYTHFDTGSVTANGWTVGDVVHVGQPLGVEGDVGAASGPHLHFEVAVPSDPNDDTPFSTNGGFITGTNRVTIVCDLPAPGYYEDSVTVTAAPCTNTAPIADAGGPYVVQEGDEVQLDGTASSDPHNSWLTYSWSPAANLEDATSATPVYSGLDDTVDQLELTVNDEGGDVTAATALSDSDTTTVTVENVAPNVSALGDTIDEAGTAVVQASYGDPGALDTHTASIDWGDGSAVQPVDVADILAGVEHVYGDNGVYGVTVTVTDDDGGVGWDTANVIVGNLDPNLTLDTSGAVSFPDGDFLVTDAGGSLPLSADGSDAGSDDLTFDWSTGDSNTHFNNGVDADPLLSPFGTFPFAASDDVDAVYAEPGVETVAVTVTDDDGGFRSADAGVIVTGTAEDTQGAGWWKHQYSGGGAPHISAATAAGYLEIVNAVSTIFPETVAAATAEDVHAILSPTGGDRRAYARAELMVAWLQFASGAVGWDAVVPLQDGTTVDFLDLMAEAEDTILDPLATPLALMAVEHDLARVRHAG